MKEWKEIERLYHLAVQKNAEERESLLQELSREDPEILEEVRELLANQEEADRIFETSAIEDGLNRLSDITKAPEPGALPFCDSVAAGPWNEGGRTGRTIGRYQIQRKIGEGGMGEVYLACDTVLDRRVALKFLPGYLRLAPSARHRFLREARTAAALDHPSICVIHEVGRTDEGEDFIVMEYVEGRTLLEKLLDGPLSWKQALQIASEVAEALEKAHRSGIVHRDLKTANIMITPEGHAKVMDFGLAKRVPRAEDIHGQEETLDDLTRPGGALGTPAYMAPEQIRSGTVDTRCDIFSFGIVLYEMLAGAHPFKKGLRVETVNAILHEAPPPLSRNDVDIPDLFQQTIEKMLEKQPDQRYQSIHEVRTNLKELYRAAAARELGSGPKKAAVSGRRRLKGGWLVAVVFVAAVITYYGWQARKVDQGALQDKPPVHRQITFTGRAFISAMSSDGQFMAYASEKGSDQSLMLQDLSGGEAIELVRAKERLLTIQWSPDNSEILFAAKVGNRDQPGIFVIPRLGGSPRRIADAVHACWSPDGSQVALSWVSEKGFRVLDRESEEERPVPLAGFQWNEGLDWAVTGLLLVHTLLYDGRHAIWTVRPDGGDPQKVFEDDALSSPRWSPRGDAIYFFRLKDNTVQLVKIPVSPDEREKKQGAIVLLSGLQASSPIPGDPPPLSLSFSADGNRMLYTRTLEYSNLWLVEAKGPKGNDVTTRQLTEGTSNSRLPSVSPDGRWVAFSTVTGAMKANIYRMPIEGGVPEQLTLFDAISTNPAWSPDGTRIAFVSNQGGSRKIWTMGPRGERPRRFAKTEPSPYFPFVVWSPGSKILYQRPDNRNFHILDPETEEEKPLIMDDSFGWVFSPSYSPDGKKVAVCWNREDAGKRLWTIGLDDSSEVLVEGRTEGQEQVATNNTHFPIGWSPDGKWIFAAEAKGRGLTGKRIVMVSMSGEEPRTLLSVPFEFSPLPSITRDGRRLVVSVPEVRSDIWMVENFDPVLRALTAKNP